MTIKRAAALILAASPFTAWAGGTEVYPTPYQALFAEDNHIYVAWNWVEGELTGTHPATLPATAVVGTSTGNPIPDKQAPSFAYKHQFNDRWAAAISYHEPYTLEIAYQQGLFNGARAAIDSDAVNALVKYKLDDQFSVYGGLRWLQVQAAGAIVAVNPVTGAPINYSANTDRASELGYVLGAAFEKPELALRVALTYESEVTQDFRLNENVNGLNSVSDIAVDYPQALQLDAQTGLSKNLLGFARIRWAEWSRQRLAFPGYQQLTNADLLGYSEDIFTFTLGGAWRFNSQWAATLALTHDQTDESAINPVVPANGYESVLVGLRYSFDRATLGLDYTRVFFDDSTDPQTGTRFSDINASAISASLAYSF